MIKKFINFLRNLFSHEEEYEEVNTEIKSIADLQSEDYKEYKHAPSSKKVVGRDVLITISKDDEEDPKAFECKQENNDKKIMKELKKSHQQLQTGIKAHSIKTKKKKNNEKSSN